MIHEVFTVLGLITVGLWAVAFHNWKAQEDEAHHQAVRTPRFLSAMAMVASAAMLGISGYLVGDATATNSKPGLWILTAGASAGFFIMSAAVFWKSTLYSSISEVIFKRAMVAANHLMEGDEDQEIFNGVVQVLLKHPDLVSLIIHESKLYEELDKVLRAEFIAQKLESDDKNENQK